ncbi:MAG: Coenzyme F420 hydrogenase/dehydrogenase, beta subunit C-terminal domain [Betaproteobacteria bacterium]|nr:Coenzyme F420 hydrogenase/dehydrogenase, beta subunit C-terminal domain [Betaproteobacteria bacterium]
MTTKVVKSSSGGLTTWLLEALLERGDIDGVVHVSASDSPLFMYTVSTTRDGLGARGKSRYYAVEVSEVLNAVRGNGRRYAFVGVPCFVKAARLIAEQDEQLGRQLVYFIGLVCGHLKSFAYAELMAWQQGVTPDKLERFDFR